MAENHALGADRTNAADRATATHTGSADPDQAADIMKDRDQARSGRTNAGGTVLSDGADTDGAGTGGMAEDKDAGGGSGGESGSSGAGIWIGNSPARQGEAGPRSAKGLGLQPPGIGRFCTFAQT